MTTTAVRALGTPLSHPLCYLAHFAGRITRGTDAAVLTCETGPYIVRGKPGTPTTATTVQPMLGGDLREPLPSLPCKRHQFNTGELTPATSG